MNNKLSSLKNLSFNVILENFSRYVLAFSSTNDNHFRRNLCFLQRVYSQNLLQNLFKTDLLREEYLDFLLNEHLKKLDVGMLLSVTDEDTVVQKVMPICSRLIELDCQQYFPAIYGKNVLKSLIPCASNVLKICVLHICDDELLNLIANFCSKLVVLDIRYSMYVTGDGLKSLCLNSNGEIQVKCPLQELLITEIDITNEDAAVILKYIKTLQKFDYPYIPEVLHFIHEKDFDNVLDNTVKYNLLYLEFKETFTLPTLLSRLKMCAALCPDVKEISVQISNDQELDACSLFFNLENISIRSYYDSLVDVNNFLSLRGSKLKQLILHQCTVSMSSLIENCHNLKSLVLSLCQYKKVNKITKTLSSLESLKFRDINFSYNHCTEFVIALLTSSPNLRALIFYNSELIESEILDKFSASFIDCKLEHLSFLYSDVKIELLMQIVLNCNFLKSLTLEYCDTLSSEDIDNLKQANAFSNKSLVITYSERDFYEYDFYKISSRDADFGGGNSD